MQRKEPRLIGSIMREMLVVRADGSVDHESLLDLGVKELKGVKELRR